MGGSQEGEKENTSELLDSHFVNWRYISPCMVGLYNVAEVDLG